MSDYQTLGLCTKPLANTEFNCPLGYGVNCEKTAMAS